MSMLKMDSFDKLLQRAKWEKPTDKDTDYDFDRGKILKYKGNKQEVFIPRYIDEEEVTCIGEGAFDGNSQLKAVALPTSIKRIDDRAFSNCPTLLDIYIPSSVHGMGEDVFSGSGAVQVLANKNSYAMKYAAEEGIYRYDF